MLSVVTVCIENLKGKHNRSTFKENTPLMLSLNQQQKQIYFTTIFISPLWLSLLFSTSESINPLHCFPTSPYMFTNIYKKMGGSQI